MITSDPTNNIENLKSKNKANGLWFYSVLTFSAIATICLLPYIHLDITSQSTGIVRSQLENTALVTPISGRITAINLKENSTVKKGDTLAIIAQQRIKNNIKLTDSLISATQNYMLDLEQLLVLNHKKLRTTTAQKEFNAYKAGNWQRYKNYSYAQKQHNRQKKLYDKSVIAQAEYEQYVFELDKALTERNTYKAQQKANWQLKVHELKEQLKTLKSNKNNLIEDSKDRIIIAPITGTIENYQGTTVGSTVTQGEVLGIISPTNGLIIENTVKPSDIGLIKLNQKVRYQIDAFNYNQWGFLEGNIMDIDKNITLTAEGAYFKVRSSLPNRTLRLKNGYIATVSKGMTLTTRYFITRRSLWQLLWDKVDDWFNPKLI